MLNDRGNKRDLFLTFASLRGEFTGRLPTDAQNMEGDTEREQSREEMSVRLM